MAGLLRYIAGYALVVPALLLSACGGGRQEVPGTPLDMYAADGASGGGAGFSSATALEGSRGSSTIYNGKRVSSSRANLDSGLVLPDGAGGVVLVPGAKQSALNPGYVDARELKLKVRELCEQLIAGIKDGALRNSVALPVSFVNMDNLEQTSSFGRFLSEQLFYEFNQRGFPIQEYRIPKTITMREGEGDFYLTRAMGAVNVPSCSVVVAGTYYADRQAVIVNARLVRPTDGMVLRTANVVLPSNRLTRRMLSGGTGAAVKLDCGQLTIRDYRETSQPVVPQTPFDQGADIH